MTSSRLYVLGARQRRLILKGQEEWNLYESALILDVDPDTGSVRTVVDYKSPPEVIAGENSSIIFKAGTLTDDRLYACTSTEILVFQLPQFRVVNYVSLPCFNDVHHVTFDGDGNLLVANTGLDMVVKASPDGRLLKVWDVLGDAPWSRFSPETDYRKVETTKPHRSHPNFVFQLDGQVWVTRFRQRDAICLTDTGKRIQIGVESPHDGLVRGDHIYFTTVDGHIVVADRRSHEIQLVVDLKEINGQDSLQGWCRGVLPVDDSRFWVGFTRVRKTKFRENVLWVSKVLRDGMKEKPTHIALYDLVGRKCLQEIDLEPHGMNIVFSIFPATLPQPEPESAVSLPGPLPQ